ncbi:MAG TPA: VOC family protein [Thermoanaerobaculia bacterium]|jgi:catechol 2,3-dioxygenase-like lactoylglutathione lyase family enzyme
MRLRATGLLLLLTALASCSLNPKPSPPRLVNQVGILTLNAKDPEALARWYDTHLGLYSTKQTDGSWAGKTASGADNLQMSWKFVPIPTTSTSTPARVSLNVSDLEFYVNRLTEAGFPPERRANDMPGGLRAYFRDPEGNEVELVQAGTRSPEV